MTRTIHIFFCILLFGILIITPRQYVLAQDSSRLRISLLTCTPGDELYSIFGHSALRVIDSNSVTDIVYNYGTFNFDDEGFYIKFMRGKLLYFMSIERFDDFKFLYQSTNRGMTEQVLLLTGKEKKEIRHALAENYKEENRYYKYDFFFDNCTTRLRDMIAGHKYPPPYLPAVMPAGTRFREAIHVYLNNGKQYWSKLGIDILLGARTDAVMLPGQQQFLPDNLMKALDKSEPAIVETSASLYNLEKISEPLNWFTPMVFFSFLLAIFILLDLSKNVFFQMILKGLDGMLFFLTGLVGCILIFMWAGTDHSMTKDNYNLVWALPTHLGISFFIKSKRRFVKRYFRFTAACIVLLLISWFFLPQQMNNALIPFVLLLMFRSARLGKPSFDLK